MVRDCGIITKIRNIMSGSWLSLSPNPLLGQPFSVEIPNFADITEKAVVKASSVQVNCTIPSYNILLTHPLLLVDGGKPNRQQYRIFLGI